MLELRPICEHCQAALPPNSTIAMICSFECTFCATCVSEVLVNVCPNCGGGFCPRPVRPVTNWHDDNYLTKYPASTTVKYRPVDVARHRELVLQLQGVLPEER